jgi:hypothetical protein
MKPFRLLVTAIGLSMLATGQAWADHHHHGHARFYIGVPLGPLYYPPPPYYYYPPQVVLAPPPAPTVYIEQAPAQPARQPSSSYWYYCASARGYYPYVKECPEGWTKEIPHAPK